PLGAETMDKGKPPRFIVGIQHFGQRDSLLGTDAGAYLHADWICDTAKILNVRSIQGPGSFANPREVSGQVEPTGPPRHLAGLSLFVIKLQPLMTGEKIDSVNVGQHATRERLHKSE